MENNREAEGREPLRVVGIGAGAGGLEALRRLFSAMPANNGMAFVVIQHVSPDFQSMMNELLSRHTAMKTCPVTDTAPIERGTVYLLTPGKQMVVANGRLQCHDRPAGPGGNMPLDILLQSLAVAYEDRAAAVILSGTGSDGSRGIQDVYHAGGLVLAQSLESARFDGMPKSALSTGRVHAVLSPEEMPGALIEGIADPRAEAGGGGEPGGKISGLSEIPEFPRQDGSAETAHWRAASMQDRQGHVIATHAPVRAPQAGVREAAEIMPVPVIVFRTNLSCTLFVNEAALQVLGMTREELMKADPERLFTGLREGGDVLSVKVRGTMGLEIRLTPVDWAGQSAVLAVLRKASGAAVGGGV